MANRLQPSVSFDAHCLHVAPQEALKLSRFQLARNTLVSHQETHAAPCVAQFVDELATKLFVALIIRDIELHVGELALAAGQSNQRAGSSGSIHDWVVSRGLVVEQRELQLGAPGFLLLAGHLELESFNFTFQIDHVLLGSTRCHIDFEVLARPFTSKAALNLAIQILDLQMAVHS